MSFNLNSLCTPAYAYFLISMIGLVIIAISLTYPSMMQYYCPGCNTIQIIMYLFLKFLFIVLWAWILDLLCRKGFRQIAWFLFLVPYIFIGMILLITVGLVFTSKVNDTISVPSMASQKHK